MPNFKVALAITQAQEAGWSEVADAVRENAAQMDELVKKKQSGVTNMTAVKNFGPSDTKPPSQG